MNFRPGADKNYVRRGRRLPECIATTPDAAGGRELVAVEDGHILPGKNERRGTVAAFQGDMETSGASKRVLVMAFSEFGRRVEENGSRGTDHGTAGPVYLVGDAVKPGLLGKYPSLTKLDDGDLIHTVDFRSVYGAVLEKWLHTDAKTVLRKAFPQVDVLKV